MFIYGLFWASKYICVQTSFISPNQTKKITIETGNEHGTKIISFFTASELITLYDLIQWFWQMVNRVFISMVRRILSKLWLDWIHVYLIIIRIFGCAEHLFILFSYPGIREGIGPLSAVRKKSEQKQRLLLLLPMLFNRKFLVLRDLNPLMKAAWKLRIESAMTATHYIGEFRMRVQEHYFQFSRFQAALANARPNPRFPLNFCWTYSSHTYGKSYSLKHPVTWVETSSRPADYPSWIRSRYKLIILHRIFVRVLQFRTLLHLQF